MALTKISTAMISQSAAAVDLNVDAGTFYVDTTNNRVGVGGKTDPDTPLHVVGTVTATLFAGSGAHRLQTFQIQHLQTQVLQLTPPLQAWAEVLL